MQAFQREMQEIKGLVESKDEIISKLALDLKHKDIKINQLHDEITAQASTIHTLQGKLNQSEMFCRERSHALQVKNIKIAKLEESFEMKNNAHEINLFQQSRELHRIIKEQEEELRQFLGDHHNYLKEIEDFSRLYEQKLNENTLLDEFNLELQRQIEEVQSSNIILVKKLEEYSDELGQQNEQSNDLLCQIEYMLNTVQAQS